MDVDEGEESSKIYMKKKNLMPKKKLKVMMTTIHID
jgi:hypothetical protein